MSRVATNSALHFRWLALVLTFGLSGCNQSVEFEEHLLRAGFSYSYGISVGDLNGDGRVDIVAADAWSPDHAEGTDLKAAAIYLYTNTGEGFRHSYIATGIEGPNTFRGKPISLIERNTLADLDGDGDLDVAAIQLTQNRAMAFFNPGGNGYFKEWPRAVLAKPGTPVEIKATDLDGDGQQDLITASWSKGGVWTSMNNGKREGWSSSRISQPDGWKDTRNLLVGDLNGNGKTDLVAADLKANQVAVISREGADWSTEIITRDLLHPWHGQLIDFDKDGDLDIIIAAREGIYLLRNEAGWPRKKLAGAPPATPRASWFEAHAHDMDLDGDLDIVATRSPQTSAHGGEVWWFRNDGGTYTGQKLKSNWGATNQLLISDLNGDGKPDILASTEQPQNEVRYWINQIQTSKQN